VCVCGADVKVNHEEEVEDETDFMDEDLGTVEHHKSIILSLLQQVKLGMDLTKVTTVMWLVACVCRICHRFSMLL
jgi:hypothetical protein